MFECTRCEWSRRELRFRLIIERLVIHDRRRNRLNHSDST
jgi:hypothetical protein